MSDGETAGGNTGGLVPQKHGGAIWQGPPRNPVPGPGRPKNEIRQSLLAIVERYGLPFVEDVLAGRVEGATLDQQERVAKLALQYGLGQQKELTAESVRELLRQTVVMVREEAPDDVAERVLARMREIWR